MNRFMRFAGAASAWAIVPVLVAGCDAPWAKDPDSTTTAAILTVSGDSQSTRLEVGVNTCNKKPRVEAQESSNEVRLVVTVKKVDEDAGIDCAEGVVVTLSQPLGERTVIEDATNDAVTVTPLED
jgi:hypothetical protein